VKALRDLCKKRKVNAMPGNIFAGRDQKKGRGTSPTLKRGEFRSMLNRKQGAVRIYQRFADFRAAEVVFSGSRGVS